MRFGASGWAAGDGDWSSKKAVIPRKKIYRNFGMPRPEGYRKALRRHENGRNVLKSRLSVYRYAWGLSGIGAEERGQVKLSPGTCLKWPS